MDAPVEGPVKPPGQEGHAPRSRRSAKPMSPGAASWPGSLALVTPFALAAWTGQLASFGDDEAAPVLALTCAVGAGLLAPLGAVVGGLVARLEGLTDPLLPGRTLHLQQGAARVLWLSAASVLPWFPLHALGALDGHEENHLLAAGVAGLAGVVLVGFAVRDRRIGRQLAARVPDPDYPGSRLDRVPAAVWIGVLSVVLLGGPAFLAGGLGVAERDARGPMILALVFGSALLTVLAAGLRATLPGIPGDRRAATLRVAGAVLAAAWVWPYLVGIAGGEWMFGARDVHGGRLVVASVAAAGLLIAVALGAASREAQPAAPG